MPKYTEDGVLKIDDLASKQLLPPANRLHDRRPVAMIECIQEIPCNSCALACKLGAITMKTVNDAPKINFDKCTGCMACVMVCPGQAVFLLRTGDAAEGYVTLPYEFLAVPKVGDYVETLDREGRLLGRSEVTRILPPERNDGTALVTIKTPQEWLFEARAIRVGE